MVIDAFYSSMKHNSKHVDPRQAVEEPARGFEWSKAGSKSAATAS